MPVECYFTLNRTRMSALICPGFGSVAAFSGGGKYINNPGATTVKDDGPLPTGTYYIVDRQSGGRLGLVWDFFKDLRAGTQRSQWFALYRNDEKIDDYTSIQGIRRGAFRLHPVGYVGISEGCITLPNHTQFDQLRTFLKSQQTRTIPGTSINYYGTVVVR